MYRFHAHTLLAVACAIGSAIVLTTLSAGGGGDDPPTAPAAAMPAADGHQQIAAAGNKKAPGVVAAARAGVRNVELRWNDDGRSACKDCIRRSPDCNPIDPATCPDFAVGSFNPGVGSASFGAVRSLTVGANGLRVGGYVTSAAGKPASEFWVF